jgi:hypothetical protein
VTARYAVASSSMLSALRKLPEREQEDLELPLFHEWTFPNGNPWTRFYRTAEGYRLRFPDLADFEVSEDGTVVSGWQATGVSTATLDHLYLNQVLPLALSRQGKLVFHASAIEVDGQAVAFLGASGAGKSTLAACFATCGMPLLTDDGLLIELQQGESVAVPSHPSVRLWEDSSRALLGESVAAAPALDFTSKLRYPAVDQIAFCEQPRALRRLYFLGLDIGECAEFVPLGPGEALIELVRHSFLLDIERRQLLAAHFDRLSSLANDYPCFRLDFPRQFAALPDVRREILAHVRLAGP